ncbi:MAG: NAAT family transporter [Ardenticatenales bacterium]|nr:NAAT family transporter [Ardenticatenales bacterium]
MPLWINKHLLEFGLLAFTSLFVTVNPLGVMPVYLSMTASLSSQEARRVAARATGTAIFTLMLFALTGQLIFDFFDVSIDSLRVVGGILFFLLGYEMLQARLSRTQQGEESDSVFASEIAITPLAIPMICGPGAITTVILMMNAGGTLPQKGLLFGVIALMGALTFAILVGAKRMMALLGESGNKVLLRLMGLLMMMIAVEFFVSGLKPIVRELMAL